MEDAFGTNLAAVRVHMGPEADRSARAVNARSYAVGDHVVFADGAFAPASANGRRLVAHELAHVVQQTAGDAAQALRIDASGETEADRAASEIAAGKRASKITRGAQTSVRRQEPFIPPIEELPMPPELPEFEVPEFEVPEFEVPEFEVPEFEVPEFEVPELEAPELEAPELEPTPEAAPKPQAGPWPEPFPPVMPTPDTEPPEEEEPEPDCGSKRLPRTWVTFFPGSKGQAGRVKASPLTRCPGNTVGSQARESTYPAQFRCLRKAGLRRIWYPLHLLHGRTRRTGSRNLHGPGNDRRNIIIGDVGVNTSMNVLAERPALARVYNLGQVLWYEAKVDEYFPPDNDFFAKAITVSFGLYNVDTGTEGPAILSRRFDSFETPPNCPTTLPAIVPPVLPGLTGAYKSTLKICQRVLETRKVNVSRGGLKLLLRAGWVAQRAGVTCPPNEYYVSLEKERFLLPDEEVSTNKVPAGKTVSLTWHHLPDGDYYFIIWSPGHDPACCLQGNVAVDTFDAPKPPPRRRMRTPEMA
jgi:hypothetical protein